MSFGNGGEQLLGRLLGANLNTTADQPIAISSVLYVPRRIIVANPSTSLGLSLAAGGIYTGASKTGTIIVPATQVYTALTGVSKFLELTLGAVVSTDMLTSALLYLALTTAHGSAATADLYVLGTALK